MSIELFGGVKIRVKINSILSNITNQENKLVECIGIKQKNKIIYKHENVKHSLIINKNNIELIRESDIFKNILSFQINKETNNEYYIKDNNISVYINIITNEINIYENEIIVKYKVLDSNTEYIYKIEVSDII